jgi:perosamine synthetase
MSAELAGAILDACRKVLPAQRPLALHEPVLGDAEQRLVEECLRSGWVSTAGPYVERFESELCAVTGARHAIAVVNGTAALHAALLVAGVRAGDEVLVPTLTFVATANAVAYCGAIPHFVDASAKTLGVDPQALDRYLCEHAIHSGGATLNRTTQRPLRALVVMHTFGHPADMDALRALADRWRLVLIEDAAESLGSTYQGKHTGTIGAVGTLSFNGNKIVTTGGGGAILINDDPLAKRARHLCTTARVSAGWNFIHDEIGYNYRLPSLNAALGIAQLEQLPGLLAAKRALARRYAEVFTTVPGVRFFKPETVDASNHWLNTLILDEPNADAREQILACLNADGICARPAWTPMHQLPMYLGCPRMPLPVAEMLARRIVNLPSGPALVA